MIFFFKKGLVCVRHEIVHCYDAAAKFLLYINIKVTEDLQVVFFSQNVLASCYILEPFHESQWKWSISFWHYCAPSVIFLPTRVLIVSTVITVFWFLSWNTKPTTSPVIMMWRELGTPFMEFSMLHTSNRVCFCFLINSLVWISWTLSLSKFLTQNLLRTLGFNFNLSAISSFCMTKILTCLMMSLFHEALPNILFFNIPSFVRCSKY